jgi:uronate dehydrogenase
LPDDRKRVLITGAAGHIGTVLRQAFRGKYRLRLMTHQTPLTPEGDEQVVSGDMANFEVLLELTREVDAVVHLAIARGRGGTRAHYHQAILETDLKGLYNVYECSRLNGVKAVVFASTNHVTGMYERDGLPCHPDQPVRPDGLYGASKAFGEALGRYYSDQYGLRVYCLRIGTVNRTDSPPPGTRARSSWISHRDMAHLVECCIAAEDVPWGIFYGISNNTRACWDLTNARELIGYYPQDDAERFAATP